MPFYLLVYNIISIDPMLRFRSMMLFYIISLAFVLFSQLITSVYANPMLSANQTSSNTIIQQAVTQNSVQESCKTCNVLVFSENGLPQGLEWEVLSINGNTLANAITPNTIVVNYSFLNNVSNTITIPDVISANMTYAPSPNTMLLSSNQFNGTAVLNISFSSYVNTSFSEEGLPTGTLWSISYGNKTESFIGNTIIFRSMAGNYPVSIPDITSGSRLYAAQSPAYVISGETVALNFSGNYIIAQPPTENTTVNESAANISTGMQKLNSTHANTSIQGKLSKALNESFKKYGLGNGVLIMQWQGSNSNLNGTAVKNSNYHSSAISKYNQTNQTSQSLYNGSITSTTNQAIQLNYTTMDNLTSLNITKANAFRTYINSSYPSLLQLQHNITVGYGSIRQSGKVVAAGRRLEFITYNENSTLVYYNISVVKASPNMSISVDGVSFNKRNSTGKIYVPVINNQKNYNLSISLKSALGNNNYAEFSYSIKFNNGTTITRSGNYNSVNKNFLYKLPYTTNTIITFDTYGNQNYSAIDPTIIVIPVNILYYVPITLTNSQNIATTAPFQQMISVNSRLYKNYEAGNLDNINFFYANGTIISSWMEGSNVISLDTPGDNLLNTSINTIYWIYLTNGIPAVSSKTIYMGFSSINTNFFNSISEGEAPELSSTYAKYDNGANIFGVYVNANTPLSDFTGVNIGNFSTTTLNGEPVLLFYASAHKVGWVGLPNPYTNFIMDGFSYIAQTGSAVGYFAEAQAGTSAGYLLGAGNGQGHTELSISSIDSKGGTTLLNSTGTENINVWQYTQTNYSNGYISMLGGSAPDNFSLTTFATDTSYTSGYIGFGESGDQHPNYYRYIFVRSLPPNNIMPSVTFGSLLGVASFSESGLPLSGELWNVTYNGITENTIVPNSIIFSNIPGKYFFSIPNQIVSGSTYSSNIINGYMVTGNSTAITFSQSLTSTCTIYLNSNVINFGNLNPNSDIPTSNSITDTNSGNTNAYLYLYGGNWVQGSESFGVSNTIYADASGVAYSAASKLTSTATNSMIQIAASSSNTIYFGLNIPPATPSSAYGQTITIENVC